MNIGKVLSQAIALIIVVLFVNLVLNFFFSVVSNKTDLAVNENRHNGYRAAGMIHIANSGEEFGRLDRSVLENKMDSVGQQCRIDEPGFREGEFLGLGVKNLEGSENRCSSVFSYFPGNLIVVETPMYSEEGDFYYTVGVTGKSNLEEFQQQEDEQFQGWY